jgi:beta-N-acetylglucosaminidase
VRKDKKITKRTYNKLIERIAEILNQARTKVVREIDKAQVLAYWEIGKEIVEFEQKGKARAEYGEELIVRLALSKNDKAVMKMAEKGQVVEKPEDAIKDPYILEFLNLREETSYTETQLEQAIIDKLQYFLLEMGKGFSFVARQKRITISNRHYFIDLVF